jgi:hypothetical protein
MIRDAEEVDEMLLLLCCAVLCFAGTASTLYIKSHLHSYQTCTMDTHEGLTVAEEANQDKIGDPSSIGEIHIFDSARWQHSRSPFHQH